jgi:site-specific DNA recombinase
VAYGYPAGAASHDPVVAVVTALQGDVTYADEKLKRLYKLVEDGITELDDVLKDRLNSLKADRERAQAALERARSHSSQGRFRVQI